MKNLLKKLSGANRTDRREALEQEAAEKIKEVGGQAPPAEAFSDAWASPAPEVPAPGAASAAEPVTSEHAPAGRRLTVQERVAARQLQNH